MLGVSSHLNENFQILQLARCLWSNRGLGEVSSGPLGTSAAQPAHCTPGPRGQRGGSHYPRDCKYLKERRVLPQVLKHVRTSPALSDEHPRCSFPWIMFSSLSVLHGKGYQLLQIRERHFKACLHCVLGPRYFSGRLLLSTA